jgi:YidC/Oxa1 family membrane protein insertase
MKLVFIKLIFFLFVTSTALFSMNILNAAESSINRPHGLIVTPLYKIFLQSTEVTSNYGVAIILITFALKLTLSPLQYVSMKSSLKMKKITPELSMIKEKWKNNADKMKEETLRVFKTNSINPLMSIIPGFLQIPLFFAFYSLLTHSKEIIGHHFFGWLTDLSLPDPLFILPIIAGLLQLVMMLRNDHNENHPSRKPHFKIVMPIIFTGFMLKLPVAILIYTISSSVYALIEKVVLIKIIGKL